MSSFSCPHYNDRNETCRRLHVDCVPGRPGCVLQHNSVFAVPVEERIRQKMREKAERDQRQETR